MDRSSLLLNVLRLLGFTGVRLDGLGGLGLLIALGMGLIFPLIEYSGWPQDLKGLGPEITS